MDIDQIQIITNIEQDMFCHLNNLQMEHLHKVLTHYLYNLPSNGNSDEIDFFNKNKDLLKSFIAAKRVEGCSAKSLSYYESTLNNMFKILSKNLKLITTDDIRQYLDKYQQIGGASKITIDNIRRILSSFFSWLEEENLILKSPVRRIHKVKTGTTVKETYSDEELELMRDHCGSCRDLAMIDLMISTGIRVGELVKLDRQDIDFTNRECIVFGKGEKERKVYFDARTKLHISDYLATRTDNDPALFVTLQKPNNRLQISGIEIRLRQLGRKLGIKKVHPHKFRRTLATMAIDKGMPIEQVQQLLGHESLNTTLLYAKVNQNNVKNSHKKFIS
jgi:site-specific recombinase XerD